MTIYEEMKKDIADAKEGMAEGYIEGPRVVLEYVKAKAFADIAESLANITPILIDIAESLERIERIQS